VPFTHFVAGVDQFFLVFKNVSAMIFKFVEAYCVG